MGKRNMGGEGEDVDSRYWSPHRLKPQLRLCFSTLPFTKLINYLKSKALKRKDGGDMISNLPDPVLHLILSRLPTTEEVIRTSILSTRWRYLWTSVPSIDIDYFRGLKPHKEFKEKKFEEFVYRVLANNSLDLDSFRLCCVNYYNMWTIGRWIDAAVRRNVKLLDLMFCPIEEFEIISVPGCILRCGSLEVLRLFLFSRRVRLPSFTMFPALRVLELNRVVLFDHNLVEAFLKSCPLLEDLTLIDCWIVEFDILCISCPKLKNLKIDNRNTVHCEDCGSSSELSNRLCDGGHGGGALQISCPKLVFLELTGRITYDGYTIEGLDSLKKAVIHPEDTRELYLPLEMMATIICELFFGITHVESLSVSLYFVYKCMDPEVDDLIFLPDFYMLNLETLEITIDALTMDVLFQFLICSPYLESLYLIIHEDFFNPIYWQLEDPITRRILTRRLKRVEFLEFNEKKWKLDVARCLLDDGHELEEMVFSWCDKDRFHERSKEIMKEVSKYYKASSTVKLVSLLKN